MENYELITSDESSYGRIVGESGDFVLVEHGTLRKHKKPVPRTLVEFDDDAKVARTTVSKMIIDDAPNCDDEDFDKQAVALHYGLAEGDPAPPSQGYGDVIASDPAGTADESAIAAGTMPAEQERAMIRERAAGRGQSDTPPSPGLLGGDRYRDADVD